CSSDLVSHECAEVRSDPPTKRKSDTDQIPERSACFILSCGAHAQPRIRRGLPARRQLEPVVMRALPVWLLCAPPRVVETSTPMPTALCPGAESRRDPQRPARRYPASLCPGSG